LTRVEQLRRLLEVYRAVDAAEAADVRRVRAALDDDVWSRSSPLHVTASVLVLHTASRRVLLRWHTRMQRWMQVGGHFDAGETDPWKVAFREAREETGLAELTAARPDPAPVHIAIVPVPAFGDEPAHEHADIRYVVFTERPDDVCPESIDAALRWMTFDEALTEVTEENLRTFLGRAFATLGTETSAK